jgi:hypothetical protein
MSNVDLKPMTVQELVEVLGLTIKKDEVNKVVAFLCQLSAYTDSCQFNISFNAPSSTGKSFIPTEIARLFPAVDIKEIGYCSPTAFFHDTGEYDKELEGYMVDLSRKVLIFLDQPHTQLLERLRPVLSHDQKEIRLKITDKSQKHGLKTKNVIVKGYPSVIFCTAGLTIDEQEATRFFLLSPEVNHEKIRQAILEKIKKETDNASYRSWLEEVPERKQLIERILAIKQENIQEVKIYSPDTIIERFMGQNKVLKPRHQRDIGRLLALVKSFALLNLWWRDKEGSTITANEQDVESAFEIWDKISVSQELNLPPYVYKIYQEVILIAWDERLKESANDAKDNGLSRQDILLKHHAVYGRMLDNSQLRQQILPMLETAGLITQEPHSADRRKLLVYPTLPTTISSDQNNSETKGGVTEPNKYLSLEEIGDLIN